MAYFPFMIQLDNVNCLVVGGGAVAFRKVAQLHEFGAKVKVIATQICEDLKELSEKYDNITLAERPVCENDLEGMEVVVMATNDNELNTYYSNICRERRILVNVVDVKKDCGFYFPAIIKQENVVIGISTGGSSPLLAARIKRDIKSSIRHDYGQIANEIEELREDLLLSESDPKKRIEQMSELLNARLDK